MKFYKSLPPSDQHHGPQVATEPQQGPAAFAMSCFLLKVEAFASRVADNQDGIAAPPAPGS